VLRLKLIACKALFRELSYLCALSDNAVDITWIRQGCHDYPDELRELLQKEIDAVEAGSDNHTNRMNRLGEASGIADDFDAILIGYGLCSNAVTGLHASTHRLVIPKAHDCITLYLGSKERYAEYFENLPGCFWYTASWIDNSDLPGQERTERTARYFEEQGYDEEMIEYLLTEIGGLNNYHHAAYIRMPYLDRPKYREITQKAADYFKWDYHEIEGTTQLFERFIAGDWDEEDFLVLEPGETAVQSYDSAVIKKRLI